MIGILNWMPLLVSGSIVAAEQIRVLRLRRTCSGLLVATLAPPAGYPHA